MWLNNTHSDGVKQKYWGLASQRVKPRLKHWRQYNGISVLLLRGGGLSSILENRKLEPMQLVGERNQTLPSLH